MFRDFSGFRVVPLGLGGVTRKIVLEDGGGSLLILKFAKDKLGILIKDYLCEYVGSSMAKLLGYPVQEVELGYYEGEECAAVKMFSHTLVSFKGLGTSSADGVKVGSKGENYNLQWLLDLEMKQGKFKLTQEQYINWVWQVFMLDMFIGNFDRHEGNWGFFYERGGYTPAPLYDNGACFYPKLIDTAQMNMSDGEMRNLVEFQTKCAIIYKGKKKAFFEIMNLVLKEETASREFRAFIKKVDETDFQPIFDYLIQYNKKYNDTIKFIKRVFNCRRELLRRYESSGYSAGFA
ncbi:MAG: HipA domain-containing protein [Oscillospiraceae bacterium]|nr:HipA domain-containing protein [Oscillospiraceae bacterium]